MTMQTFFVKKNKYLFFTLLVFILAFGIRCYKFSDKGHLFLDEYLSIVISNDNGYGWDKTYENDSTILRGQDLTAVFLSDTNDLPSILEDIQNVRIHNSDISHTNLYFSLIRLSVWNVGPSVESVIHRYFGLNLLFFLFSFLLLYRICIKLKFGEIAVIGILAVTYLNPISVGNSLYLRPYAMQELFFLLLAYLSISYYCLLRSGDEVRKWYNLLSYAIAIALVLLTGYFAIFYVFLIGLFLLFVTLKYDKKNIWFLMMAMILAGILLYAIYPIYINGLLSPRGTEAMDKLKLEVLFQGAWDSFIQLVQKIVFLKHNIFPLLLTIVMFAVFFIQGNLKKHLQNSKLSIIWFCIGFLWCWGIFYIAPYKTERYIAPAMPLVLLFIPIVLSAFDHKRQMLFALSLSLLLLFITLNDKDIYWSKDAVDKGYLEQPETPSIIAGSGYWHQVVTIPYYTEDRPIELTFSSEDMFDKVQKYDSLYLFIIADMLDKYPIPENYEVESNFAIHTYYEVYRLRKK